MLRLWLRYRVPSMLDTATHIAIDLIAEEATYAEG